MSWQVVLSFMFSSLGVPQVANQIWEFQAHSMSLSCLQINFHIISPELPFLILKAVGFLCFAALNLISTGWNSSRLSSNNSLTFFFFFLNYIFQMYTKSLRGNQKTKVKTRGRFSASCGVQWPKKSWLGFQFACKYE